MTIVKEDLIRWLQSLDGDLSKDDLDYYLQVREKVQRGLRDAAEGKVLTEEEVERRMDEWAESIGLNLPFKTTMLIA